MKNSALIQAFKEKVGISSQFSTRELSAFLQLQLPDLQESTIGWRINQLKKEELIFQVGRGMYSFEGKQEFEPTISLKGKRLYNRVARLVPNMKISIWELQMLDEFLTNTDERKFSFISTKKEDLEVLFNEMMGFSKKVYLNPSSTIFNRYMLPLEEAIILTPLVSEAPIVEVNNTWIPTLEGLLVNAFVKDELIIKPTGRSLDELFKNAFEKYHVNQSKLFRYAARRDKREELEKYLQNLIKQ